MGGTAALGGTAADPLAIARQEHSFALYAWPAEVRRTGTKCFFVNEMADVYFTRMDAATYDGTAAVPPDNAAYVTGSAVFRGKISSGTTVGNDNNQWFPTGG